MFDILRKFQYMITHLQVIKYEIEENQIRIHVKLILTDESQLIIRDYKFVDNTRKYSYHWMDKDGNIRVRWDNASHWKSVVTFPHHKHVEKEGNVISSTETDTETILNYIKEHIE